MDVIDDVVNLISSASSRSYSSSSSINRSRIGSSSGESARSSSSASTSSSSESDSVQIIPAGGLPRSNYGPALPPPRRPATRASCKACRSRNVDQNNELKARPSLEVFFRDRWCTVDSIHKEDSGSGSYIVCVDTNRNVRIELQRIRLSSRKANGDDCALLTKGVDISVFARHPQTKEKAWYDAKIAEVYNRPHITKCDCKMIVKLYSVEDGLTSDLMTFPDSIGIARIKILQAPNGVDFVDVVQAAIRPGLTKRIWSRDIGSIGSRHDRRGHDLGFHQHHHHDEAIVISDDSLGDDFDALLDADFRGLESESESGSGSESVLREVEVVEEEEEEEDDDDDDDEDEGDEEVDSSSENSLYARQISAKIRMYNRHDRVSRQPRRTLTDAEKRIRSSLSAAASRKRSRSSRRDRKRSSKKRKRNHRSDRSSNRKRSSRPSGPPKKQTHIETEDLEQEQGYLVSLDAYWNRKHSTFEQEPTEEEALFQRLIKEMEAAFPRKDEQADNQHNTRIEGQCEEHDYVMNELEGLVCAVCGHIGIPVDQMAPYIGPYERPRQQAPTEIELPELGSKRLSDDIAVDRICLTSTGVKRELRPHQKQAVRLMQRSIVEDKGGCIVAHAAGTGKTFATVYFYARYKEIMARCRLLILCPKAVQKVWRDEFRNLELEMPSLISTQQNSKRLKIVEDWHRQQGALVMSYCLFVKMSSHKKFQRYLLAGPELVILDEAHTFRSSKTSMWNALSRMRTRLRILLSGTLFQNTFVELFNLFYLARPDFMKLEDDMARKWFREEIGRKFDDGRGEKERRAAQEKLIRMTRRFTDHYSGDILKQVLKGLFDYEVTTNPTEDQIREIGRMKADALEADQIVTKILIHPLLGNKDENIAALTDVDIGASRKTAFVMKLIELCQSRREKVLVFGEYLAPFELLMKMMESEHNWAKGREVVYLHGSVNPEERHELIDTFNEEGSKAVVCLASIKACSEGINLIGASRVVLLHPVWNPAVTNQAISRAYRLGQTRPVFVYRLVTGTEEEKNWRTKWKDNCSDAIRQKSRPSEPVPQKVVLGTREIFREDELVAEIYAAGIIENVCHRDHSLERDEQSSVWEKAAVHELTFIR